MSDTKAHVPVLLAETLAALNINADGCYIDGTFGRGGHSACLLDAKKSVSLNFHQQHKKRGAYSAPFSLYH